MSEIDPLVLLGKIEEEFRSRGERNVRLEKEEDSDYYIEVSVQLIGLWEQSSGYDEKARISELLRFALFRINSDTVQISIFDLLYKTLIDVSLSKEVRLNVCLVLRFAFSVLPSTQQKQLIEYLRSDHVPDFILGRGEIQDLLTLHAVRRRIEAIGNQVGPLDDR